jgi:hypothetical protein
MVTFWLISTNDCYKIQDFWYMWCGIDHLHKGTCITCTDKNCDGTSCTHEKGAVEHVQDDSSLQYQVCNIVVDYLPRWMGKLFQQPKCHDIYDCKC